MQDSRGDRPEQLFVRYWDGSLSRDELRELNDLLRRDVSFRRRFELCGLIATNAAQAPSVARASYPGPQKPTAPRKVWSRRGVLASLGGGAVAAAAGAAGFALWPSDSPKVRLAAVRGRVRIAGRVLTASQSLERLEPASAISTLDDDSLATLSFADGSTVTLIGISSIILNGQNDRVELIGGQIMADLLPRPDSPRSLILATSVAALRAVEGANFVLASSSNGTEISVDRGQVAVSDSIGRSVAKVDRGELLTVRAGGNRTKVRRPLTPDSFAWDLTQPLPKDWAVGFLQETDGESAVRSESWFDPYHAAQMHEIRSNNNWARGLFRLDDDSRIRFRYRVERPGRSQICICIRTESPSDPTSGVLGMENIFAAARPGQWEELDIRAGDMMEDRHVPNFQSPWIGFLVIFNTYEPDLGLAVSDFRVAPPGVR